MVAIAAAGLAFTQAGPAQAASCPTGTTLNTGNGMCEGTLVDALPFTYTLQSLPDYTGPCVKWQNAAGEQFAQMATRPTGTPIYCSNTNVDPTRATDRTEPPAASNIPPLDGVIVTYGNVVTITQGAISGSAPIGTWSGYTANVLDPTPAGYEINAGRWVKYVPYSAPPVTVQAPTVVTETVTITTPEVLPQNGFGDNTVTATNTGSGTNLTWALTPGVTYQASINGAAADINYTETMGEIVCSNNSTVTLTATFNGRVIDRYTYVTQTAQPTVMKQVVYKATSKGVRLAEGKGLIIPEGAVYTIVEPKGTNLKTLKAAKESAKKLAAATNGTLSLEVETSDSLRGWPRIIITWEE